MGQLPDVLAAAAATDGVLLVAEGVSVKASGSLRIPVRRSSSFVSMHAGCLVIAPGRLLASVGRYLLIDDWPTTTQPNGSTHIRVDPSGVELTVDIAKVVPGGTGQVDIVFHTTIPPLVLGALPAHKWQGGFAAPDPQRALRRI